MSSTFSPPLPPDLQQFLQHEVASGNYLSEDEVFVDALRLLREERSDAIASLEEALAQMDAGKSVPLQEAVTLQREQLLAGIERCQPNR